MKSALKRLKMTSCNLPIKEVSAKRAYRIIGLVLTYLMGLRIIYSL